MVALFRKLMEGKRRPQGQNTQPAFMPAPQGGINALDGAASASPLDALFLSNLIPQEYGCATRKGYREWCPPVPQGDGVKTVIPFTSDKIFPEFDKLFCVTNDGIYEITVPGAAPIKRFNFLDKSSVAGWCTWHHYSTIAGQFLLIADLRNGYIVYNATTDTFAVGDIQGPNPQEATLDFVTVWKNRVWLVQRTTGLAWYLPVGQISGTANSFNFANKFKYGGFLRGVFNWTIDGGEGIDDYLVAVSSAGDVVVYKGTDPASATTFAMVGYYWIGRIPEGRRFTSDFGGDLLLLSSYGMIQMSKLIAGLPMDSAEISISQKVNPRLNTLMERTLFQFGWEVRAHPREQLIFVSVPKEEGLNHQQYVFNTATRAWCQFVGIPYLCGEVWQNDFYIGSRDNQIFRYTGNVDNVLLADDGASANAIEWSKVGTFHSYGQPARNKRVQFLRPQFIGDAVPSYTIAARYDFDLSLPPGSPPYVNPGGALWNNAIWDQAVWGGGFITDQPPRGGSGLGRHISLVMRGRSSAPCIFIGCDVLFDMGGLL